MPFSLPIILSLYFSVSALFLSVISYFSFHLLCLAQNSYLINCSPLDHSPLAFLGQIKILAPYPSPDERHHCVFVINYTPHTLGTGFGLWSLSHNYSYRNIRSFNFPYPLKLSPCLSVLFGCPVLWTLCHTCNALSARLEVPYLRNSPKKLIFCCNACSQIIVINKARLQSLCKYLRCWPSTSILRNNYKKPIVEFYCHKIIKQMPSVFKLSKQSTVNVSLLFSTCITERLLLFVITSIDLDPIVVPLPGSTSCYLWSWLALSIRPSNSAVGHTVFLVRPTLVGISPGNTTLMDKQSIMLLSKTQKFFRCLLITYLIITAVRAQACKLSSILLSSRRLPVIDHYG